MFCVLNKACNIVMICEIASVSLLKAYSVCSMLRVNNWTQLMRLRFTMGWLKPRHLKCNQSVAKRKWAHKIGKLQEPPTRNIPCLNV